MPGLTSAKLAEAAGPADVLMPPGAAIVCF